MDKKIFPLGMSVPMPPGSTDRESILGIRTVEVPNPSDEEIMGQYSADIFSVDAKGNKILNENVFAEAFCEVNHLRYSHGLFYTRNGKASEEMVARDIWDSLRQEDFGFTTDMERRTKKLLGTVKLAATVEKLEARTYRSPTEEQTLKQLKKQKLEGKTRLHDLLDQLRRQEEN